MFLEPTANIPDRVVASLGTSTERDRRRDLGQQMFKPLAVNEV
jgi:hypothetical protein